MTAKDNKNKKAKGPVTVNKKAFHEFNIEDKYEAGMSLVGSEVKSLRSGQADLSGSYARVRRGEIWLMGASISQYDEAGINNHDPKRSRKLLLHKSEIRKITTRLEQRGYTLVPLKIYFNERGYAKCQLALAKGKRKYDKRKSIAEKEQKRRIEKQMKNYR